MSGLKELRVRINSVKSTEKITSAMKMVAASRLRRAQLLAHENVFYYDNLLNITHRVIGELNEEYLGNERKFNLPKVLQPLIENQGHLLVVISSDKGLCGGYNSTVAKETRRRVSELREMGKDIKILCVGKKARDLLRKDCEDLFLGVVEDFSSKGADYNEANSLNLSFQAIMEENNLGVCEVIYTYFHSAMNREPIVEQLYPMVLEEAKEENLDLIKPDINGVYYEYEPNKEELLDLLLEKLVYAKFYKAIVNSIASEHGARMTSMDAATRNAEDMIGKLTLRYNGVRQSAITTELIEIIAGAEAI